MCVCFVWCIFRPSKKALKFQGDNDKNEQNEASGAYNSNLTDRHAEMTSQCIQYGDHRISQLSQGLCIYNIQLKKENQRGDRRIFRANDHSRTFFETTFYSSSFTRIK